MMNLFQMSALGVGGAEHVRSAPTFRSVGEQETLDKRDNNKD